jgi:hypothetical protein
LPAEPAAGFNEIKWDRHPLVTTGPTGNDRHFRTADPERFGE